MNTKKVPVIPPILIKNKLEADFFKKANYFDKLFASKCMPFVSINFSDNDIRKMITTLDIHKTHGHNNISARMVKTCDDAIKKPLSIIYKNCTETGIYPNALKKCNIVPVHMKGDKQTVNNYFW